MTTTWKTDGALTGAPVYVGDRSVTGRYPASNRTVAPVTSTPERFANPDAMNRH